MRKALRIPARIESIPDGIMFIQSELNGLGKKYSKIAARSLMLAEDIMADMIKQADEDSNISITVNSFLGNIHVEIRYTGEPYELPMNNLGLDITDDDIDDEEALAAIKGLVRKAYTQTVEESYKNRTGKVTIWVARSSYTQIYKTIGALLFGIAAGLIIRYFPQQIADFLTKDIFKSVYTMFLNAIKMVVAPLVLFSIASSVAGFGDLKQLGKIGGKIFVAYVCTSIIAIFIGFGVYNAMPLGDPALVNAITDAGADTIQTATATSVSIKDTIVNIVPSNLFTALSKSDMLQLIFFAVLLGIAATMLKGQSEKALEGLQIINDLFSKITAIIIEFMPIAIFCSIANLAANTGFSTMVSMLSMIGLIYIGDFCMILVYAIMVLVAAKLNPLTFLKKYAPVALNAYSFASSNAVLPLSMEVAGQKLGISKKLYSFSLPLGSTVNMDGSCIALVISTLFMAKVFGVTVDSAFLTTLFTMVLTLSIGAPGVPGAALVCIALILPQVGVPVEAVSLIIPLYSLIGSMLVVVNCMSDSAVTTIIAKRENMIDLKIYNGK